ncbi:hypothetical protein DFP73DRAFT_551089 [Morchella snyderi]|nr:hypothetical protein DFP73DRAFT_551089 [Morchella snyderi]
MQLTTLLLLSLAALINAAPAPVPAPADSAQVFNYMSCMTVSYDTPQGIAFYQIENKDSTTFKANCKKCMYACSSLSLLFLLDGYMLTGFMHVVGRRVGVGPIKRPVRTSLMSVQRPCRNIGRTIGALIFGGKEMEDYSYVHAWSGPSRPYFFVLFFCF